MRTHDGIKYKIEPIEIEIATGRHAEHCETKWGYSYYIDDYDYESDEWYETESEAIIAAEDMIGRLDSAREEGNYEERMAMKPHEIDWEERRRMGE